MKTTKYGKYMTSKFLMSVKTIILLCLLCICVCNSIIHTILILKKEFTFMTKYVVLYFT